MKDEKISNGFFFPRVRTPAINKLLTDIDSNWEELVKGLKDRKREEVGMTLHRLKEALVKLDLRFFDL